MNGHPSASELVAACAAVVQPARHGMLPGAPGPQAEPVSGRGRGCPGAVPLLRRMPARGDTRCVAIAGPMAGARAARRVSRPRSGGDRGQTTRGRQGAAEAPPAARGRSGARLRRTAAGRWCSRTGGRAGSRSICLPPSAAVTSGTRSSGAGCPRWSRRYRGPMAGCRASASHSCARMAWARPRSSSPGSRAARSRGRGALGAGRAEAGYCRRDRGCRDGAAGNRPAVLGGARHQQPAQARAAGDGARGGDHRRSGRGGRGSSICGDPRLRRQGSRGAHRVAAGPATRISTRH